MNAELTLLTFTAASIAFFHTLLGPDHYLPFIAMGKAKKWSLKKTGLITFFCGLGHVGSSICIGLVGILTGSALGNLRFLEQNRGEVAAWGLMSFGFLYMIWGIKKMMSTKPHRHFHVHSDGQSHSHPHHHDQTDHLHVHEKKDALTPWILFIIFVFGPCEPLIPILMFPAFKQSVAGLLLVTGVFSFVTLVTMIGLVALGCFGLSFLSFNRLERYVPATAGGIIFLSGVGMVFLGL